MTILFLITYSMKYPARAHISLIAILSIFVNLVPFQTLDASSDKLVYPLKVISKLECRFEEFDTLSSNCKQELPILTTKDYKKYATQNNWYNDFTRIYTVLWGASYKYGWDVWNGGHPGTDFATAKWTPVYSIADGKVIVVSEDSGWGKNVSIEHTIKWEKIISNYAHLSAMNVKVGERVSVGEKIGEVWSTGNSTWNHLHFQIDLPNTFHPYFYEWNTCPYAYYKISETGLCFDQLESHTFDPLEFLETNGWIIDEVKITSSQKSSNSNTTSNQNDYISKDIFSTTVYRNIGSSSEVKEVQKIYRDLGYYNGSINWDFEDVESSIVDYQVDTGVISSRNDDGAGWFGPKTRAQTKIDYEEYEENKPTRKVGFEEEEKEEVIVQQKTEKIEKENLMTREEREAQEMAEFLKTYNIEIKNSPSQLNIWENHIWSFEIRNRKGKGFKGNSPWTVNFVYDKSKISIFPESFFNFRDGMREIEVTGKAAWNTTVEVRIGEVIVDTFSVTVWEIGKNQWVSSAIIYSDNSITLWEEKHWVVVMNDTYNNKLVATKYNGNFTLQSDDNIEYCIKRWKIADIKELYKRTCFRDEYKTSIDFNYSDTVWWILVFNYRVLDDNANIEVEKKWQWKLSQKSIVVTHPKNLVQTYEYYDDVITTLMNWVTDGVDRWYFLEDTSLTKEDAKRWLLSAMEAKGKNSDDIRELERLSVNPRDKVTRKQFLVLTNTYLWWNYRVVWWELKDYTDMQEDEEKLVRATLWYDYSWKDNFWEKYFQPDKQITRWEAAYMLMQTLEVGWNALVARN